MADEATGHFLFLPGRTLAEIEEAAIRAAFTRLNGNRRLMVRELEISRSNLLRKLDQYALRPRRVHHPREPLHADDVARTFYEHRKAMLAELKISDSTLVRWINNAGPFVAEEDETK